MSAAVAALISNTNAVKIQAGPDVWGPNGEGYSNTDARYDASLIGINITKAAKAGAHQCQPGDWVTAHWTATLDDNRVVANSREQDIGLPKKFILGNSEVFKCWDLGVQKLSEGAEATLSCPSYLAWGGAFTQAPLGGNPIPLHSNIRFGLEIESCTRNPTWKAV